MKSLKRPQIRPSKGYGALFNVIFVAILPLIMFILVRLEFVGVAFLVVLLSKWRMFALRIRHWPASFRINAVDLMTGFSVVAIMALSNDNQLIQVAWAIAYLLWLLVIKPKNTELWIGVQAMIAQTVSLVALFMIGNEADEAVLVALTAAIAYLSARHFLAAFDETMAQSTAYVWAFFCGSLAWVSSKWLLYYGPISQPALIITVIGYCLAAIYYLEHKDRLKRSYITQFVGLAVAIVLFILIFSDWSGEII